MQMNKSKLGITIDQITVNDLPPQLRPFYRNSPAAIRMMNVTTALVCWMANATRLRVKYCFDMWLSMLAVNVLCIAPSGAGKSIVRWIVNMLMEPLKLRDAEERRREQEYSDKRNKKAKDQELPDEPLSVVRYMQSITVPKLVKRADFMARRYGAPLTFFIYTDELATMCTGSRQSREEYSAVARTAYQKGEVYIRETLYQEGYNAAVDVNWCSVMCGQDYALDKYIDKGGIMMGDAGRQILFRLDSLGDDAYIVKPFSDEERRLVNATTQRLMDETYTPDDRLQPQHEVDMSWLTRDVQSWCHEQAVEVSKNGSRAQDSFYKRASVSAFRMATMMYYLWGEDRKAQKHVRRCYFAYANYILETLMKQWGRKYEQLIPKTEEATAERPSLYDQLPQRFTRDQLREMILKLELSAPARVFIHKWLSRKFIYKVEDETDVYEKIY